MKPGKSLALAAAVITGIAIVGPAFSLNHSTARQSPPVPRFITRSVIKVHTDHGVIVLPGSANSWDEVERAQFVAESIADMQIVNNEVPLPQLE